MLYELVRYFAICGVLVGLSFRNTSRMIQSFEDGGKKQCSSLIPDAFTAAKEYLPF
jgi:hypothetical protein